MKTSDFLGNTWDIDCMGCAISEGKLFVPGGMIKNTQHFCVHQDPLVPLPGFLVIGSIRHIRSISEMQEVEYEEFSRLIRTVQRAIKEVTQVEYLTIVQEESSVHFHLWFFPWTIKVIERYGNPSLTNIRDIIADQRKHSIGMDDWEKLAGLIRKIKALIH